MTTLVTGVAGLIGYHVAEALLAKGETVVGLDDFNRYYDIRLKRERVARLEGRSGFLLHTADVADLDVLASIGSRVPAITRIVHLAAQAGVRYSLTDAFAYVRSNIVGHLAVIEFARRLSDCKHVVYASSSSVYGGNKPPFAESDRPAPKLSLHTLFCYILKLLYTGCQWKELPIEKDQDGRPEIHYTRVYGAFRRWQADGCFDAIFAGSVLKLHQADLLDISVIHGDGTTTAAKKGGDNIGFNAHKKVKGDKVVAFCDRNCNVIAPFVSAPGNRNESPLLREALPTVMRVAHLVGLELQGAIVSLDGVYDCRLNRKAIFNRGMVPNINANPRGRKATRRGRKPLFDAAIFKERFHTIERVFSWEDKFRRLLLRFEHLSQLHYAFKTLAYTMINLRHFCQG